MALSDNFPQMTLFFWDTLYISSISWGCDPTLWSQLFQEHGPFLPSWMSPRLCVMTDECVSVAESPNVIWPWAELTCSSHFCIHCQYLQFHAVRVWTLIIFAVTGLLWSTLVKPLSSHLFRHGEVWRGFCRVTLSNNKGPGDIWSSAMIMQSRHFLPTIAWMSPI